MQKDITVLNIRLNIRLNSVFQGGVYMSEFQVVSDPKEDIKFWSNLLNKENLNEVTIKFANKGLQIAIENYLNPIVFRNMKEKDELNYSKSAYDLVKEREKLQREVKTLAEKSNSNFGRHMSIWDSLSKKQEEIRKIDEQLKKVKV